MESMFISGHPEQRRLNVLADLHIMDSSPEASFDNIVNIASQVCQTPIALISLVDDKRQWFKSRIGLDAQETPREIAFCTHAIAQPNPADIFVVPDAEADVRFSSNPLVTGHPDIRFYAGAQLVMEGDGQERLGTLCVIDTKPRDLTDTQRSILNSLAQQVVTLMNYRKMARLNYEQGKFFNSLSEFSPHGIFKTDAEGRWVYVNPKCAEICGQSAENLMGLGWISCLHPDDLDSVISKWKSHFEAGTEFQLDYRFLIEKEVRYISCMAKPIVGMNDKQRRAYVGNMEDVTEKKLTLQKEDLLQKQLQLSLSRFAVGIWERNLETEKIIWDSSMYDLYGVPPKAAGEVTYSTWYNVVHPDDRKQIVEGFDITNFATPDKHSRDDVSRFRIVKPDGQIRYIFSKHTVYFNENGHANKMIGLNWDVTDEELLKQQISARNEKFEIIFTSMRDGIVLIDAKSREVLEFNAAAMEFTQLSKSEFKEKFYHYQIYQEDGTKLPYSEYPSQRAIASKKSFLDLVGSIILKDGSRAWMSISAIPLFGHSENNDVEKVLITITDITERKKNQAELAKKENELMAVLDGMPAKIAHWDLNCRNIHANKAYCDQLGVSFDQVKGKPKQELIGGEMYDVLSTVIKGVLQGNPQKYESELTAKDGSTLYEYTQLVPDINNGTVTGYFSITTDITEFKLLEKNLILAREAEKKANAAKSGFLASMSHELRTPLNGIIGMTSLLVDTKLDEEQRDYAETISSSGKALLTIINDILDFSKIEAGKMVLESIEFDIIQTLKDLTKPFHYSAQKKGISFELISTHLPHKVIGDDGRIGQIVYNLVGNAIKFTKNGGVIVKLEITSDSGDDRNQQQFDEPGSLGIKISVKDTGIGIPAESRSLVFQSFVQAQNSIRRNFGGTGLGLSISKRLVEMMEGKIYFESVYGEGTVFVVELTLAKGGSTSPKAREHTSSSVNIEIPKILPTQKYSGRILVAEDNQTNQKVIERMLQKRGCKFLIVANGNEVLKALGSGEFNLILMDCQMPEMDGYETTRIIRSSQSYPSTIPIVALTANAIQGDEEKCMECGMDDYISKPINQRMLDQALQKYLNPSMSPVMSLANPENRHSQCGVSRPASPLILSSVDVNALALLQNNRYQGRSDLIRLIDSFLEACPQTLALVEHCLAESEFHRIGKEAFYLKLSAQAFGAQRLAELCQKMHDITLLDNQRVDLYADIFPKVKSELENVVENLQSIKASPSLYTS